LIPEYQLKRKGGKSIEPDGAIVDSLSQVLRYGLWEAKDTDDDLEKEVKAKFKGRLPARQHPLPRASPRHPLPERG